MLDWLYFNGLSSFLYIIFVMIIIKLFIKYYESVNTIKSYNKGYNKIHKSKYTNKSIKDNNSQDTDFDYIIMKLSKDQYDKMNKQMERLDDILNKFN
jgi:sortase (surface protein transpeptidase)